MKLELLRIRNRLHNNYLLGGREKDKIVLDDLTTLLESMKYDPKDLDNIYDESKELDIEDLVCHEFEINKEQLYSKSNKSLTAMARHVVMWYDVIHKGMFLHDAAERFNSDKSNSHFAKDKVNSMKKYDPIFSDRLDSIVSKMKQTN